MPRFSLLFLPTVLAVAIYLFLASYDNPIQLGSQVTTSFPTDVTSVANGINTISYDEQGAIAYTLQAEVQIQRNDDTSELQKPIIRLFRDNSAQWNIVANSGNISARPDGRQDSSRQLTLTGEVQLISLDDFGNRTTLDTDYLTISPDGEVARTDRTVHLTTTNIRQSARGMIADFGNDEISFLSNIEGRYVPTTQ